MSNLQQRIGFVYNPLTKIWAAKEAEKESYVADERETTRHPTTLLKISYLFDHVVLLLGQAMKSCLCIRHFNVLMSFVGDKKRAESVLKHNATEYTGADDMLFGLRMRN